MQTCPYCHAETLVKAGLNPSGSQRFFCKRCERTSTLHPNLNGYSTATHQQVLRLYLEGNGIRRIARLLQLNHQTVANWINAAQAQLAPTPPQPAESAVIELDELYTFVGAKKTKSL